MVILYYANSKVVQGHYPLAYLLDQIPENMRPKALRYRFEKDAYNYVLGRLLLQKGLKDFGFDSEKIEEIRFNQFEKPLLEGLSFSISHSKNMVVCALSQSARLGVDIEVDGKVKLNDLKSFFTDKEWSDITSAKNQRRRLFQYWTRKESILKAIGTGLAKLEDIHLLDEKRGFHKIRSDIWHFYELDLGKTCITTLCVDTHPIELKINPFSVGDSLI